MKKNKLILLLICTMTLLSCGAFTACRAPQREVPKTPVPPIENEDEWTNNY
ncbi:MAG: hypothetical protein J6S04_02365 [Clostridia bacterium]|nr:hypothetical protein [Clostridia bacterium]